MAWLIWLVIFVILVGIEAATMLLTTIWFAGGAIVALVLAVLGVGGYAQVAAFFVVSCLLLCFTRPLALRYVNRNTVKTNAEGLIGKTARVTSEVNNDLATGTAVVSGQEWTARSADGSVIPRGTMVRIEEIRGVRLMVSILKEDN